MLDEALIQAIIGGINSKTFSTYPQYENLRKAIGAYGGVESSSVCLSSGSDALISAVVELCTHQGYTIALPTPTFYGYERIIRRHNAQILPTFYEERDGAFIFPLSSTIDLMKTAQVQAIFLCNPNNPLGVSIPEDELALLLDVARDTHTLAIVDEAYYEFGGTTVISRLETQPLLIIRTLSKSFALAGARVGYCMGSTELIAKINTFFLPWPIAHLSVMAALILLEHEKAVDDRRALVIEQRDNLIATLSVIPDIHVYSSKTNFVLLRVRDAARIAESLEKRGFIVAVCAEMSAFEPAKKLLSNTIRIAIPSPEDTHDFVESLKSSLRSL